MTRILHLPDAVVQSAVSMTMKDDTSVVLIYSNIENDLDLGLVPTDWVVKLSIKKNKLTLYPILNGIVIVKGKEFRASKNDSNEWVIEKTIPNIIPGVNLLNVRDLV